MTQNNIHIKHLYDQFDLQDADQPYPGVEITIEDKGHFIDFLAEMCTSWEVDGTIIEKEKLFSGTMKWDGCSHLSMGDEEGYVHLCGGAAWEDFRKAMEYIESYATKVKKFDIR